MLDLASERWHELTQAYGSATDIPRLLDALATNESMEVRAELWFGVFATLCPDDAAYSSSYAAVPHLMHITRDREFAERVAAIHVVVRVEAARHLAGAPAIPDDLIEAYAKTVESLPAIVAGLASHVWAAPTAQILAAALLVGKHQPALARAVLASGEIGE